VAKGTFTEIFPKMKNNPVVLYPDDEQKVLAMGLKQIHDAALELPCSRKCFVNGQCQLLVS